MRTFRLSSDQIGRLREGLPDVAVQTIEAITAEVPAYAEAFTGEMGSKIERAVRAALGTFLDLVSRPDDAGRMAPALEGAYALGAGEARSGRSLDALLAAYRVGARVSWRELAAISVRAGEAAPVIAHFAELVFAHIDELSAASVKGHADELATTGRARLRRLERLAVALLAGDPAHEVQDLAERADWAPPQTLTAVLVPERGARAAADLLAAGTLVLAEAGPEAPDLSVLLVPDVQASSRAHLTRLLAGRGAVVGPARPWLAAGSSLARALRVLTIAGPVRAGTVLDTEDHLVALVVTADGPALADLRARVLAPLAGERAATAAKLAETLRSWLLHHGRREDVAADLFIHPQTVRYRMSRLRELYGDRLNDPDWTAALIVGLSRP